MCMVNQKLIIDKNKTGYTYCICVNSYHTICSLLIRGCRIEASSLYNWGLVLFQY